MLWVAMAPIWFSALMYDDIDLLPSSADLACTEKGVLVLVSVFVYAGILVPSALCKRKARAVSDTRTCSSRRAVQLARTSSVPADRASRPLESWESTPRAA